MTGQLQRLQERQRAVVAFELDGERCEALAGDTVLTAILTQRRRLRDNEFTATPRAGFCMMGACHDCIVWTAGGERVRACTTMLQPGMCLMTEPGTPVTQTVEAA
ncbi:(2Fe-2S)-binding protein [Cupriavidus pampae]|uniref:Hydrogen cyanide synthase subunit HcnA n=1 Tax=Cupriavidus pampae TaxID=659251 RepID=A0ABN7ZFM2_9BURK|nr:(2Fe-2S)-binding protein [Cupriavidus pampae]CAG9183116.1 Hydrogen cyanide synthase subunit HcnA [Cupriavidus pampae]